MAFQTYHLQALRGDNRESTPYATINAKARTIRLNVAAQQAMGIAPEEAVVLAFDPEKGAIMVRPARPEDPANVRLKLRDQKGGRTPQPGSRRSLIVGIQGFAVTFQIALDRAEGRYKLSVSAGGAAVFHLPAGAWQKPPVLLPDAVRERLIEARNRARTPAATVAARRQQREEQATP